MPSIYVIQLLETIQTQQDMVNFHKRNPYSPFSVTKGSLASHVLALHDFLVQVRQNDLL